MFEQECVKRAIRNTSNHVWLNQFYFCPLLTLSTFLELYYPVDTNENDRVNLFVAIGPTATGVKQKISRHLKKIFIGEEIGTVMEMINEIVGSHRFQKFALIRTRRSGCNRDYLNIRGR